LKILPLTEENEAATALQSLSWQSSGKSGLKDLTMAVKILAVISLSG
jgi:hypothetical protein